MLYVVILIAVIAAIFALSGIRIVSQSETMIIERLGKYHKTLEPGINIIIPVLDKPKVIRTVRRYTYRIDIREQVMDFEKQNVITKDNVMTEINALLYFQIVEPTKAAYEIENFPLAVEKLTQTTLRNVVGEMELDETLTSRDQINTKLQSVLDDATNKWGIKVNRVELQDIMPPASIRVAMEKQMQAERDRRAEILKAEGEKKAAILQSEGEKQSQINIAEAEKQAKVLRASGDAEAQILRAQAEATAIQKVAEAIPSKDPSDPVNYLIAVKYIECLKQLTQGKDTKTVYLPYEATGVLGSLGGIKDLFKAQ